MGGSCNRKSASFGEGRLSGVVTAIGDVIGATGAAAGSPVQGGGGGCGGACDTCTVASGGVSASFFSTTFSVAAGVGSGTTSGASRISTSSCFNCIEGESSRFSRGLGIGLEGVGSGGGSIMPVFASVVSVVGTGASVPSLLVSGFDDSTTSSVVDTRIVLPSSFE